MNNKYILRNVHDSTFDLKCLHNFVSPYAIQLKVSRNMQGILKSILPEAFAKLQGHLTLMQQKPASHVQLYKKQQMSRGEKDT